MRSLDYRLWLWTQILCAGTIFGPEAQDLNTMVQEFYKHSIFLTNFGIRSESHHIRRFNTQKFWIKMSWKKWIISTNWYFFMIVFRNIIYQLLDLYANYSKFSCLFPNKQTPQADKLFNFIHFFCAGTVPAVCKWKKVCMRKINK